MQFNSAVLGIYYLISKKSINNLKKINNNNMSSQQEQGQPRPLQMGAKGAYIVRLLMVGDSSCGKTSLVLRFDQNVFSTKFVTTIGVDYRDKMVKVCLFMRVCVCVSISVTVYFCSLRIILLSNWPSILFFLNIFILTIFFHKFPQKND